MVENRLLDQFNTVITSQWSSTNVTEKYAPLTHKELFELAYHTNNNVATRNIYIKLSSDEKFHAVLYSQSKKFISIETLDDALSMKKFFGEGDAGDRLVNEVAPKLKDRKKNFAAKDDASKEQILKSILVERKLDECANLVMIKDINRKIYFAIGDARESAAVVPMFMEAEGASTVQLALNKWMSTVNNLEQESLFPDTHVPGLLKNLMQIKKWLLNLISTNID